MSRFQVFLIIAYLFFFGSFAGWVLELFFRRYFSKANPERKWLNPGFLFGPCVPLYGFGTLALYGLSDCERSIFGSFDGSVWFYPVMFFLMTEESTRRTADWLLQSPQGVYAMSLDIPGLVQTSCNMGIFSAGAAGLHAVTSVRSSIATQKQMLLGRIGGLARMPGKPDSSTSCRTSGVR